MVMFYPFARDGKDSPNPELVVDRSLLNIQDADLKDYSKFISKMNFSDANGYIVRFRVFLLLRILNDRLN